MGCCDKRLFPPSRFDLIGPGCGSMVGIEPAENPTTKLATDDAEQNRRGTPVLLIRRFIRCWLLPLHQFDVEAQRLQFADEYVEGFGHRSEEHTSELQSTSY